MPLRKFNETFYNFRPEPIVKSAVVVTQKPYQGSGGRWYMDVRLVDESVVIPYYDEMKAVCPGTFIEGHMKLKIPIMKCRFTHIHRHITPLNMIQDGAHLDVVIACAGMFVLKGVWKPSWKLKVIEE